MAGDASLINVAVSFTLQKTTHNFCTTSYDVEMYKCTHAEKTDW